MVEIVEVGTASVVTKVSLLGFLEASVGGVEDCGEAEKELIVAFSAKDGVVIFATMGVVVTAVSSVLVVAGRTVVVDEFGATELSELFCGTVWVVVLVGGGFSVVFDEITGLVSVVVDSGTEVESVVLTVVTVVAVLVTLVVVDNSPASGLV